MLRFRCHHVPSLRRSVVHSCPSKCRLPLRYRSAPAGLNMSPDVLPSVLGWEQYVPGVLISSLTGLDPGTAAFAAGFLLRFVALPGAMYLRRQTLRFTSPPIRTWALELHEEFHRLSETSWQALPCRQAICRYQAHLLPQRISDFLPLNLSYLVAVGLFPSHVHVANSTNFYHTASFLWMDSLGAPDPHFVLPAAIVAVQISVAFLWPKESTSNAAETTLFVAMPQLGRWVVAAVYAYFAYSWLSVAPAALSLYVLGVVTSTVATKLLARWSTPPAAITEESEPELFAAHEQFLRDYNTLYAHCSKIPNPVVAQEVTNSLVEFHRSVHRGEQFPRILRHADEVDQGEIPTLGDDLWKEGDQAKEPPSSPSQQQP